MSMYKCNRILCIIPMVLSLCACSSNKEIELNINNYEYSSIDNKIYYINDTEVLPEDIELYEQVCEVITVNSFTSGIRSIDDYKNFYTYPMLISDDIAIIIFDDKYKLNFTFKDEQLQDISGAITWDTEYTTDELNQDIQEYSIEVQEITDDIQSEYDLDQIDINKLDDICRGLAIEHQDQIIFGNNYEVDGYRQLEYSESGLVYTCYINGGYIKLDPFTGEDIGSFYFNGAYT